MRARVGNIFRHFVIIVLTPALCLGLPVVCSERFRAWASGKTIDAASSASVVVEQPSGECTVFINRELHPDEKKLGVWQEFFEGKEIPVIFEDITCTASASDSIGVEMAQSFQSRLPEHQMEVKREDTTLLLSKAEYGKFDVILLSDDFVTAFGAEELCDDDRFMVIRIKKEDVEE